MDYEKKYNEALKWMRELYPGLHGAAKEDAEHYFPELRESEDERIRKRIIEFIRESNPLLFRINDYPERWIAWLENQKEYHIPWYDYQKSKEAGYTIVPNEEYEQLIKQKEQNPAWSEEDERMVRSIIERGQAQIQWCDTGLRPEQVSWLKSLRPQPHWKPSEEQMRSLRDTIINTKGYQYSVYLPELYEQLKKL